MADRIHFQHDTAFSISEDLETIFEGSRAFAKDDFSIETQLKIADEMLERWLSFRRLIMDGKRVVSKEEHARMVSI